VTEPYDAAAELTKLARWIDTRLDNERADRQYIAEQALARIRDIAGAMCTVQELAARRAAAMPPVDTEEQADELPAVLAAREAYAADPGPARMAPHSRRILTEALEAAGVKLGGFDRFVIDWLAGVNVGTCAVVAGWVIRAAAGGTLAKDQAEFDGEAGQ
jgi:hypothetical protein